MPIIKFKDRIPKINDSAWIAPDAWITGAVTIGEESSVFFASQIRGDVNPIVIGNKTNIQEQCILHTSHGLGPCQIGDSVTVGHGAILHGCTIKNNCIIGMGSTILDNAIIEENCIIGANSLVTMNQTIPSGSLAFGSPAKVIRKLTEEEIESIKKSASNYIRVASEYKQTLK